MNCCADPAHWVAKVKDGGLWADLKRVGADRQDGWDNAECSEAAARSANLAIDVPLPVLLWDAPILLPELEAIADLYRDNQEISAAECLCPIRRCRDAEREPVLVDKCTPVLLDDGERIGIDI